MVACRQAQDADVKKLAKLRAEVVRLQKRYAALSLSAWDRATPIDLTKVRKLPLAKRETAAQLNAKDAKV